MKGLGKTAAKGEKGEKGIGKTAVKGKASVTAKGQGEKGKGEKGEKGSKGEKGEVSPAPVASPQPKAEENAAKPGGGSSGEAFGGKRPADTVETPAKKLKSFEGPSTLGLKMSLPFAGDDSATKGSRPPRLIQFNHESQASGYRQVAELSQLGWHGQR